MRACLAVGVLCVAAAPLRAQQHVHTEGMTHGAPAAVPAQSGQAAFAAIAEIVRLLQADSATDWSKVNLEALRQHLVDMDNVVLRSEVQATPVPGGVSLVIRGQGAVVESIQRMAGAHAKALDGLPEYRAESQPTEGGVTLVVTSEDPGDARAVARIRALGFAGLLAEGDHHAAHHLALARGADPHKH